MPPEFQVPLFFDYFATFLWALSGAIVGLHKRYDFAGVLVVALLSATGAACCVMAFSCTGGHLCSATAIISR